MYRVDRDKDTVTVINTSNARVVYKAPLNSYLNVDGKNVQISTLKTDEELLRALVKNRKI